MPALRKHSVTIAGHRTSIALEAEFWSALRDIAEERGEALAALIAEIDAGRLADPERPNLSSAIRLFVLDFWRRGKGARDLT